MCSNCGKSKKAKVQANNALKLLQKKQQAQQSPKPFKLKGDKSNTMYIPRIR